MIKININKNVLVKVTPLGHKIYKENFEKFWSQFNDRPDFLPIREDDDGYSRWQLWHLMKEFGNHLKMGFDLPIETEIILIED